MQEGDRERRLSTGERRVGDSELRNGDPDWSIAKPEWRFVALPHKTVRDPDSEPRTGCDNRYKFFYICRFCWTFSPQLLERSHVAEETCCERFFVACFKAEGIGGFKVDT